MADKHQRSMVGNETKADMKGAMSMGRGSKLKEAVTELHAQHPHGHEDHGPHHGGKEHMRHMPLHGMKPSVGGM